MMKRFYWKILSYELSERYRVILGLWIIKNVIPTFQSYGNGRQQRKLH